MAKKFLFIVNNGPEDPNRATVPFLTAKALIEKGQEVAIWLYNNSVYLVKENAYQYVQAPGLPPLEDLLLFCCDTHKMPVYIGVSCAVGRGLVDLQHKPLVTFSYGELKSPPDLAQLMMEADDVVGF